jgi:hypothetical protein
MKFSIDVAEYYELPPGVRARFDGWLRAETLIDKKIVRLVLDEGAVHVERIAEGPDGRPYLDGDDEIAVEKATYFVRTPPPLEAFQCDEPEGRM